MKTSNKILLGAFITALLLFGSLYASVYIRYKKGNYSSIAGEAGTMIEVNHHPGKISYVSLKGVSAKLYNAEKPGLQFIQPKDEKSRSIKYEQRGG